MEEPPDTSKTDLRLSASSRKRDLVLNLGIILGFVLVVGFIVTTFVPGIKSADAKPPPAPKLWSLEFISSKAYWTTVAAILVGLVLIFFAIGNLKRFLRSGPQKTYARACLLLTVLTPLFCGLAARLSTLELSDLSKTAFFLLLTVYYLVQAILAYAEIYAITAGLTKGGKKTTSPADCLYFSGVTWTTLGYGDIVPETGKARFFAITEALNAYVFLGTFISVFTRIGIGS